MIADAKKCVQQYLEQLRDQGKLPPMIEVSISATDDDLARGQMYIEFSSRYPDNPVVQEFFRQLRHGQNHNG